MLIIFIVTVIQLLLIVKSYYDSIYEVKSILLQEKLIQILE
jgi:hypothetical protein